MALRLELQHLAGARIDLIIVLPAICIELHIIDHDAVIAVQLNFRVVRTLDARVLVGQLLRLLLADIGLVAGGAGGGDILQVRLLRLGQQVQLVDRQLGQIVKLQQGILVDQPLDERRSACGNLVGARHFFQLLVAPQRLTEDRALDGVGVEQLADFLHQLLLQRLALLPVAVFHRDQNGIRQIADVAVLQHGADQRVDRHIQVGVSQIHPIQNSLRILVERLRLQHLLPAVYLELDAGVDIDGHYRIHPMVGGVAPGAPEGARHNQQGGSRARQSHPAGSVPLPGNLLSFRPRSHTLGSTVLQRLGSRVIDCHSELALNLSILHIISSAI